MKSLCKPLCGASDVPEVVQSSTAEDKILSNVYVQSHSLLGWLEGSNDGGYCASRVSLDAAITKYLEVLGVVGYEITRLGVSPAVLVGATTLINVEGGGEHSRSAAVVVDGDFHLSIHQGVELVDDFASKHSLFFSFLLACGGIILLF